MLLNSVFNKFQRLPESLRHSLFFGLSMMGIRLVGFLLIPVFTHYLTPSQYARLDLLQSLADIIGMVVIVGLADTLFKFVGEEKVDEKKHQIAGRIYRLSVGLSLVCCVILQLSAPIIKSYLPLEISAWSIRFILMSVSISPMILVALSWLRMEGYLTKFVKETIVRAVLQGALSVAVLVIGFGVSGVMASGMCASIITAVSLHRFMVRKKIWAQNFDQSSVYLRYGGPLIFVGIAGFFLRSFDRWMLAGSIGAEEMAMYALAVKFALIAAFLTQPYQMWFLPKRFSLLKNKKTRQQLGEYSVWGCVFTVLMAASMSAGAPVLIYVMTPSSYHSAIEYIPFLCFCAAMHMSTIYLNIGCYAQKTTKWPLIIDSASAGLVVILYILLIPIYGAYGALAAGVAVMISRLVVTMFVSRYYKKIDYKLVKLFIFIGVYLLACACQTILELTIIEQFLFGTVSVLIIFCVSVALELVPLKHIVRRANVIAS